MNLKKAMSLPINMIIVVAIGFTLLILAIFWIKNFFGGLTKQTQDINRITSEAIDSLVVEDPTAEFFLSKDQITIKLGQVEAIAYLIRNFDQSDNNFYMAIECVSSDQDPDFSNNCNKKEWFLKYLRQRKISAKGEYKDALVITAPKGVKPGNYVFDLRICKGSYNGNDIPNDCGNNDEYSIKTLILEVK
ncbi:MAG TPA: hypothetical protein EYH54_02040 [Nautiliaceae bacterium]|nr:hypothetical protein [Nautiliaceae bacterium]